jgi:hypothetical protein
MSGRRLCLIAVALCLSATAFLPATAAADAPAWSLSLTPMPTNLVPGGNTEYLLLATNVGGKVTSGSATTLAVTVPEDLEVTGFRGINSDTSSLVPPSCTASDDTVTCETAETVHPGRFLEVGVATAVPALEPEGILEAKATVSGGGASTASIATRSRVQAEPVSFDILPGFFASTLSPEGTALTLAGSHPGQQTISFGFPTKNVGEGLTNDGHPRNISVQLPPGLIGDPAATPVLCTEAELISAAGCPLSSQVGVADVATLAGEAGNVLVLDSSIYNMVPPPGSPAELATDVADVGVYLHILVRVRSEGDYGIEATTRDVIAFGQQPIFNFQAQIWGDPSAEAHDSIRGACIGKALPGNCPVTPRGKTAFLTMPTACSGNPLTYGILADTWEEPSPPFAQHRSSYESADSEGNLLSLSGCNQLEFEPKISARPTTNLTDSPAGLDVRLHQPQDTELDQRSTAQLKDATVTLPAGMAVNPSQADGLAACSSAEIGLTTPIGASPIHFSRDPAACPDASKLGTLEVTTPLLAQYDESHQRIDDPETGRPKPEPLHGAVYLAKPFDNPFGSLLAIYLSIDDPRTGTVAKLAGRIEANPVTGQLTTRFSENPQLPLEDIKLHLFPGARASLISPPVCGTHNTTTDLVPWSSPEGADATPSDSFQTTAAPGGGACPSTQAAAPNAPAFTAGTMTREAGKFSPFALKISREDGSQRLTGIDTLLPPGLAARFAGVAECSEAEIAHATARNKPEEGILERRNPSCPAASELGTVVVGAGAGPTPFYTSGHVYLAGPYKGAPLSLAIVTPAIAGPFDLGTVVVRTALYVEPETAQGRAVSDPLPTILDGIPLDVRSIALKLDRPKFTLNPTSCDPLAITGAATSALGASAALTTPFQVGGCNALPFKPKLSLSLKGGTKRSSNPRLIANLKAKPGEANIARAQVKLPHAAFLDQAHIKTICTRVQFAADTCPPGSVYGKASATTPLLDYTLSGPVYLRSSNHPLPDLVVKLKGPASQPIEIDLAGKTDAVKAALRNTFEAVPDAPVSSFHLELFGGKRGLVELSQNLCARTYRAVVQLSGQNGKVSQTQPKIGTSCRKKPRHHRHR